MQSQVTREEGGQALVMVALAMAALLAFLALAIDVGSVYAERRRMQNAADAGALAGAKVLCTRGFGAQAEADIAARDYATRNGAQIITVTFSAFNVVDVSVQETTNTFFAGLIGFPTVDVAADAAAACGTADTTCGIWPIAFPESVWMPISKTCDSQLVIIDSDKVCGDEVGDLDCGPDEVSTGGERAWLDFAQPDEGIYGASPCTGNCGAAALRCWIENLFPGDVPIPICIRGEPGVMGSAFQEAGDPMHHGQIRKIPIFDSFADDGVCPEGDDVLGDSCNNNRMYHIVAIACVKIDHYEPHYEIPLVQPTPDPSATPDPEPTRTPRPERVKALIVTVACDDECDEECASTPGGMPAPGNPLGVSLVR